MLFCLSGKPTLLALQAVNVKPFLSTSLPTPHACLPRKQELGVGSGEVRCCWRHADAAQVREQCGCSGARSFHIFGFRQEITYEWRELRTGSRCGSQWSTLQLWGGEGQKGSAWTPPPGERTSLPRAVDRSVWGRSVQTVQPLEWTWSLLQLISCGHDPRRVEVQPCLPKEPDSLTVNRQSRRRQGTETNKTGLRPGTVSCCRRLCQPDLDSRAMEACVWILPWLE